MDLKKYLKDWSRLQFDKNSRIFFMLFYAILMLTSITNEVDMFTFIVLFLALPIGIYYFVKYNFPTK